MDQQQHYTSQSNIGKGGAGIILASWGSSPDDLATGNLVYENTIENNGQGKEPGLLLAGYNNTIFLNNFLNNYNFQNKQGESPFGTNAWDGRLNPDDLLWGGNFWSDYNETNKYGMGVVPYVIDSNNIDHYPLTGMVNIFDAAYGCEVAVISNSSISNFEFNLTQPVSSSFDFQRFWRKRNSGFC